MRRTILTIIFFSLCCFLTFADNGAKPVITVLDFELSGLSLAEGRIFLDFLSSHISETKKFRLIDRSQRETLLEEMRFSLSGCSDESCQLEIGRLLAADFIVVGSIGTFGNRYLLNTRLISVETNETEASASEKYDTLDDLLDDSKRIIGILFGLPAGEAEENGGTLDNQNIFSDNFSNELPEDYWDWDWDEDSFIDFQTIDYSDGSSYCGQTFNFMAHGTGIRTWPNGDYFDGRFLLDRAIDGYVYFAADGSTAAFYQDANGGWINGDNTDNAERLFFDNGDIYSGAIKNNLPEGYGCKYYADGTIEAGTWTDGLLQGQGVGDYAIGWKYKGSYANGMLNGWGEYWDGGGYYYGQFTYGVFNGEGTFTWNDGTMYQGQYEFGLASGGTIYYADGRIAYGYQAESGLWITE